MISIQIPTIAYPKKKRVLRFILRDSLGYFGGETLPNLRDKEK